MSISKQTSVSVRAIPQLTAEYRPNRALYSVSLPAAGQEPWLLNTSARARPET